MPNTVATYLHVGGGYAEIRALFGLLAFGLGWYAWRRIDRLCEVTVQAVREKALAGQAPLEGATQGPNARTVEGSHVGTKTSGDYGNA